MLNVGQRWRQQHHHASKILRFEGEMQIFINSQKRKKEIQQPNSSLASMSPPKMSLGGDVEQVERCDVEWIQMERSELISIQSQGWRSQRALRKEVWVIRGSLQVSSGVSLTDPENMNSEKKSLQRFHHVCCSDWQTPSSQSQHTRVQHGAESVALHLSQTCTTGKAENQKSY